MHLSSSQWYCFCSTEIWVIMPQSAIRPTTNLKKLTPNHYYKKSRREKVQIMIQVRVLSHQSDVCAFFCVLSYLMCTRSLEPNMILGMSQARQNSRALWPWAGTEQPTASAAATFSPFGVGGLEPAESGQQRRAELEECYSIAQCVITSR